MFVDLKCSTVKAQVNAYWNLVYNKVFWFSMADFHFVKPGLAKHVLLV